VTTDPTPTLALFGSAHVRRGQLRFDLPDAAPGYLVAYLATRGDRVLREELAVLLWPEATEHEAQNKLRVNLARNRSAVPPPGLASAYAISQSSTDHP